MKRSLRWFAALAALTAEALFAQDLWGSWLGTLPQPQGEAELKFEI